MSSVQASEKPTEEAKPSEVKHALPAKVIRISEKSELKRLF